MKAAVLLLFVFFVPNAQASQEPPRQARVAVSVADLRQEPSKPLPTLEQDPREESQLLYGDPVEILEEKEGWARVVAVDQPEYTHHKRWEGYPGWVESQNLLNGPKDWKPNLVVAAKLGRIFEEPRTDAPIKLIVSLGTSLVGAARKIPSSRDLWWELQLLDGSSGWIRADEVITAERLFLLQKDAALLRKRLVENARLFLGDPYYWGGRSAHNPQETGPVHATVDCSGFIGLLYQANGLHIPRDAHEQWMLSKPVDPKKLLPGDLIFLHDPEDPDRIVHVMMSVGQDEIIEAPGSGGLVRQMNFQERLKEARRRRISFGTYIL